MLRRSLRLVFILWAGTACAGDQPDYAPPASWVKLAELPSPQASSTTDIQFLLEDFQSNVGPDGDDYYQEVAERIQTAQGLEQVGNVVLAWRPDIEALVIHKLHIIRDGKIIDVLADGQKFLVLRRENNLELAMLDGALTAAIQPEGLEVGDTLDIAFTKKLRDPLFKGHSQLFSSNFGAIPIRRLSIREIWPQARSLQWRQTEGLSAAKVLDTAEGKELTIDMVDTQPIKPPRNAPGRFSNINRLEVSEFSSWAEVSALMTPLYDRASELAQDSPIRAEINKIASLSDDPKTRAAAALHLVQDKVRYLFLGMDRGGYVPAAADRTWTRRFGDCKGKTVLLLALLRELGIDAQPALVSSGNGDGLDEALPMVSVFDHVIVRARIGEKTYWLDGTRTGDRGLDDLMVPRFSWALPLQPVAATLEKLVTKPFERPETSTELHLDASAGLDVPAPAHAVQILRGDEATAIKVGLGGKPQADVESYLRRFWTGEYNWIDIKHVAYAFDETTGEARLSMDGTGKMDWKIYGGYAGRQFEVDDSRLGWTPDYNRDPGPHQDAPFAVRYPYYISVNTTVVLPKAGVGFAIQGTDSNKTAGGYELKRRSQIDKGVFTMIKTVRSSVQEFPAADAPAAKATLHALSEGAVYIHAPTLLNEPVSPGGAQGKGVTKPSTELLLALAAEAAAKGDLVKAIKAFGDVLAVDPGRIEALTARAILYVSKGDIANAANDIEQAERIDPRNQAVTSAQLMLDLAKKDYDGAIVIANDMIKTYPGDGRMLAARAQVYRAQGKVDQAQADYDEAVRLNPDDQGIRLAHAQFLISLHKSNQALSDVDKLIALAPDNSVNHDARGFVLASLGRRDEAIVEYNAALAIKPDAGTYLRRALARNPNDSQLVAADLESSLKLQPNNPEVYRLRAKLYLAAFDFDDALTALNAELGLWPGNVEAIRKRAFVYAAQRRYDAAIEQVEQLASKNPDRADLLMELCRYKAARGQNLDEALTDCQKASALVPASDDELVATAFVEQRMGRFDSAMKHYDAVLGRRSNSAVVHFGRGLTEIAMGAVDRGKADLIAARKINGNIDLELSPYIQVPDRYKADRGDMQDLLKALIASAPEGAVKAKPSEPAGSSDKVSRKPISIVRPNYPDIAEDYQVEGYVDFEFVVETDGTVGEVKVTREYPEMHGFGDSAVRVFPKWKFTPETVDGKAVPTHAYYRFSFKLG